MPRRLPAMAVALTLLLSTAGTAPVAAASAKFRLSSPAFGDGGEIPSQYTGEDKDLSPPLRWSGTPPGTRELALVCDDPDAPSPHPWVHWVLYKIPPQTGALPEGLPDSPRLENPPGALQGMNSWPTVGYRGPLPPPGSGWHHYHFTLFALGQPLAVGAKLDKEQLLKAMAGHVLSQTELVGKYKR